MILYLDTSALLKKYFKEFLFACYDQKLLQAAQMEGLETLPARID